MQRRRPNPRVRRAAQQEPDRHEDGPLSGRGESTGRYARIDAGRPPSPAGDGPARLRRAATGGTVLASWAVLVAWLIASAPPLQTVEAATAWPRPTNSPWMRL